MTKVTENLQITIPGELAERYGIKAGDDVEWREGANGLQLSCARTALPIAVRLDLFDRATMRADTKSQRRSMRIADGPSGRGWTREQLYNDRGRNR